MLLTLGLCLSALAQNDLPGSKLSVSQAREEARIIVVAEVTNSPDVIGSGPAMLIAGLNLKPSAVLKGEVREGDLHHLSASAASPERCPRMGDQAIFFINDFRGHPRIIKMLRKTPENVKNSTPPS